MGRNKFKINLSKIELLFAQTYLSSDPTPGLSGPFPLQWGEWNEVVEISKDPSVKMPEKVSSFFMDLYSAEEEETKIRKMDL